MLALSLVAAAVGIGNFAAAVGLGIPGVTARLRLEVALVFGVFEGGMPIVGLIVGHQASNLLGKSAGPASGTLLGLVGAWSVGTELVKSRRSTHDEVGPQDTAGQKHKSFMKLIVTGAVLGIDNLVVGFALGTYRVGIVTAAILIGAVSVILSLAGLEVGRLVGSKLGPFGELVGGLVLIVVGVCLGTGLI